MTDERDARGFGCYMDGDWLVDVLLPGFIEANSAVQWGNPVIISTRMTCDAYWPWELRDNPEELAKISLTREQVIAMAAFDAGVEWQRSRKRRKRIEEAVSYGWAKHWEGEHRRGEDRVLMVDALDVGVGTQ